MKGRKTEFRSEDYYLQHSKRSTHPSTSIAIWNPLILNFRKMSMHIIQTISQNKMKWPTFLGVAFLDIVVLWVWETPR